MLIGFAVLGGIGWLASAHQSAAARQQAGGVTVEQRFGDRPLPSAPQGIALTQLILS